MRRLLQISSYTGFASNFMTIFKRVATRLPDRWHSELKRIHYARQIRRGTFEPSEPEYEILPELIESGDWVIDIGANVGHYTKRFSELVGADGRVIAFEPVPTTFALLAANAQSFAHANVTLINTAISETFDVFGISIPRFSTGLSNYYKANLVSAADSDLIVLSLSVDVLCMNRPIALIKIDVEGHESSVLRGMERLLARDHPILIIETVSKEVIGDLSDLGYAAEKLANSPNMVFKAKE